MTTVGCAPAGTPLPLGIDTPFVLYGHRPSPNIGAVGATIPPVVRALGLSPAARAWDFLSIALSVIAADESTTRTTSADGWTRQIKLTVAVIDPHFWNTVAPRLEEALRFLTADIWKLEFIGGGYLPAPPNPIKVRSEDVVCLLSGGMDSLIGAIDLVAAGHVPFLVSQIAKGDKHDQRAFAQRIAKQAMHLQVNHNASPPGPSERSQRARSIMFCGIGVLATTCLQSYGKGAAVELFVPENGFISLNVPLTPMRLGSLSTRTTHPFYLAKLQGVFDAAGLKVKLVNPYQYKTKGEMLADCKNQPLLKQLIGSTTSCGRYARTGFRQCGRCVPCLVRRSSFLKWGVADTTPAYKYDALGTPGRRFRDFDDVRSVAVAVHTVDTLGAEEWIGGALNSAIVGDTALAQGVAERGLAELKKFLQMQGVL